MPQVGHVHPPAGAIHGDHLSSLIEEYNINCTIDGDLAMIKWYTNCLKSDIKEVSLTLLGADIALFARGF